MVRFVAFVLSLACSGLLFLLLQRTRFGRAVRATVQNPTSARLLGVQAQRVSALGFGLGAATAAAAGSVYGLLYPFNSGSHYDLISPLLSIVVLGGMGSIGGAVVAAVVMGVASSVVVGARAHRSGRSSPSSWSCCWCCWSARRVCSAPGARRAVSRIAGAPAHPCRVFFAALVVMPLRGLRTGSAEHCWSSC